MSVANIARANELNAAKRLTLNRFEFGIEISIHIPV
jgi:hypothetical protein